MAEKPIRTQADFNDFSDSALWREELAAYLLLEDWHEIGAAGQPAFQNSWDNVGGANDETAAFRLTRTQELHMKGYIDSGSDSTVIFQLPTNHRPNKIITIPALYTSSGASGGTHSCHLEIRQNGDVYVTGISGSSPIVSLHLTAHLSN